MSLIDYSHQTQRLFRNRRWGRRAFNPASLSRLLVLILDWTLRFCRCWRSSEQGALGSRTSDRTSTIIGSRWVLVPQAVVCQWRHWFCDTLQFTDVLGSGLSQFAWLLQSVFGQPPTYRLCATGPYFARYDAQWGLTILRFLNMRVSQEKSELNAVLFVSSNTCATVLSQVCRTTYNILHKITEAYMWHCVLCYVLLISAF